jgi:membrane protease YdiL (CAAX protease family)
MRFVAKIFWNENERRLRALWRLVLQIVLLFIVLLVLKYVILSITALVGLGTQSLTPEQMNYDAITALFLKFSENHYDVPLLAQEFVSTLVSVWLAGRLLDRRRFADFGLRLNKNWWIDFGFGLFLGGFLITLVFLIQLVAGWITVTGVFVTDNPANPFIFAILYPAVTMLLVGIQEELIFRGYQLTNLAEGLNRKRLGPRGAVISAMLLSAVIFALLHANNPHASAISTLSAFTGGIIAALGFVLTGELAIPIGLHITWNFFQANVFGLTLSGMEFSWATFLATEQSGPALWVGDAFGPEAGLLAIGTVMLGCLLILLWVRLRYGRVGLRPSISTTSTEETFTMKKSHSLFIIALIIILSNFWLGSAGCTSSQPKATSSVPPAAVSSPTAVPEPTAASSATLQAPLGNAATIDGVFSPGE